MSLHKLLLGQGYVPNKGIIIDQIGTEAEKLHVSQKYDFCVIPANLVPEASQKLDRQDNCYILYLKLKKRDGADR